jgi:hypothetical protein
MNVRTLQDSIPKKPHFLLLGTVGQNRLIKREGNASSFADF